MTPQILISVIFIYILQKIHSNFQMLFIDRNPRLNVPAVSHNFYKRHATRRANDFDKPHFQNILRAVNTPVYSISLIFATAFTSSVLYVTNIFFTSFKNTLNKSSFLCFYLQMNSAKYVHFHASINTNSTTSHIEPLQY
jgi:hypothetical protein